MFIDLNLITAFHRIAKSGERESVGDPRFHSLLAQVHSKVPQLQPNHLTNTVWALAKLGLRDEPLLDAIAAASLARMDSAATPELALTLWAFASLEVNNHTLLDAIAAASLQIISEFSPSEICGSAWSLARLQR